MPARLVQPTDDCVTATAGEGFVSMTITNATALDTVAFTASVDTVGLDAVVTLSAGVPVNFNSLATAVRFNTDGKLDARNGNAYAADVSEPYGTAAVDFRVIADVTSKTYSVFASNSSPEADELARQYAFRPTALPSHLDTLSAEVDGASGTLTVCAIEVTPSTGLIYSREGTYAVVPLASNTAAISDGTTTQKLNATGKTTATFAAGGQLATDAAGDVSIAGVAGTSLTVTQVTSAFAERWQTAATVAAGTEVGAVSIDTSGLTHAGIINPSAGTVTVNSYGTTGLPSTPFTVAGSALTFDGAQAIVANNTGTTLSITKYSAAGAVVWADAFSGEADIVTMAVDPSHNLLFGGELGTPINFGGGTVPIHSTEDGRIAGFLVKLSSAGAHVFSFNTDHSVTNGVAANASKIVVSNTDQIDLNFSHFTEFDPSGTSIATTFDTGLGEQGVGGALAINSSGRVWWDVSTGWPFLPEWPYLVTITP